MKRRSNQGEHSGHEEAEEQTCPEGIHCVRYQNAEDTFESTNASIKALEDDEAYGRLTATEGIVARDRTRTPTIVFTKVRPLDSSITRGILEVWGKNQSAN